MNAYQTIFLGLMFQTFWQKFGIKNQGLPLFKILINPIMGTYLEYTFS